MSIVQKYQFGGSDGLAAALNLENMATIMTSTFQLGGGGFPEQLKRLGVPAGLVLSEAKEIDHNTNTKVPDVMPDEMFDRMLSLVGNIIKIKPALTKGHTSASLTKRIVPKQKGGKLTRRKK